MRHRFHSICPYFAMFPESFAERWIGDLTKPGQVILDPFCGRGTAPFQALLMNRRAIGLDVNDVAYCVTRAKTNSPSPAAVLGRLTTLERRFRPAKWDTERQSLPEFFRYCFAPSTLRQLLFLRSNLKWRESNVDCMVAALTLGALHGETEASSAYLSNQMPRTISTKPDYSVRFWKERQLKAPRRDVFEHLRSRVPFRYASDPPTRRGLIFHADMRMLPRLFERRPKISCVITSPPYFNVTNFEEDQWLRLWLLGGPPYPTRNRVSRDDRYGVIGDYWRLIADMWRALGLVMERGANVIIRLGATKIAPEDLQKALVASTKIAEKKFRLVGSEVSEIVRRQTDRFRPGSEGCRFEVDCHFAVR